MVEDDAPTRRALVDSLELLNYRELEATDGREAIALHRHFTVNDPRQVVLPEGVVSPPE